MRLYEFFEEVTSISKGDPEIVIIINDVEFGITELGQGDNGAVNVFMQKIEPRPTLRIIEDP